MRSSAVLLLAAASCTFDASGLGETPLTGGGPGTSATATTTTLGSISETASPTTEDTIGVSGSGTMTGSSGGPGGDPTTSPGTATTTTTEPLTTGGPGTTSTGTSTTTGEPCEEEFLYADMDNDGFGDPNMGAYVCVGTQSWVPNDDDCNDMSANAKPGYNEVCDGIDNDCDGIADEYDAMGNTMSCMGCSFRLYGDHLYYFCGWGANWNDAEAFCVARGLHLAKDDGGNEHDWLLQQMGDSGLWWIGANDKGSEGQWKWISDGSAVPSPGLWGAGEPNDQEWWGWEDCDCAGLLDSNGEGGYPGQGGRWNDHECGDGEPFICEGPVP